MNGQNLQFDNAPAWGWRENPRGYCLDCAAAEVIPRRTNIQAYLLISLLSVAFLVLFYSLVKQHTTMEMRSTPTLSSASTTIEIITWFLLIVSVFAIVARLSTKWARAKRLNWDDLACIISLVRDSHQRKTSTS